MTGLYAPIHTASIVCTAHYVLVASTGRKCNHHKISLLRKKVAGQGDGKGGRHRELLGIITSPPSSLWWWKPGPIVLCVKTPIGLTTQCLHTIWWASRISHVSFAILKYWNKHFRLLWKEKCCPLPTLTPLLERTVIQLTIEDSLCKMPREYSKNVPGAVQCN